jgi:hypothetical protein
MSDFEISDDSWEKWPTMADTVANNAFTQASEFMAMGQSPSEAGSIVAHAFIIAAWQVAGCGRMADGYTPNPDNFRSAVEKVLERVKFDQKEGEGVKYNLEKMNYVPECEATNLDTEFRWDSAFLWDETPEGTEYWINIDPSSDEFASKLADMESQWKKEQNQ